MPGVRSDGGEDVEGKESYVPETEKGKSEDVAVHQHRVHLRDVDEAAKLVAGLHDEITPEQSLRVRRKIDRHMLPLMCVDTAECTRFDTHIASRMVLYFVQFTDKTTVSTQPGRVCHNIDSGSARLLFVPWNHRR